MRRILPLPLFVNGVVLIAGLFVMLPDDLENLAESVVATNFFLTMFCNTLQWATIGQLTQDTATFAHMDISYRRAILFVLSCIAAFFQKQAIVIYSLACTHICVVDSLL